MSDEPRPEPLDLDDVDESDLEYRPFVKYVGLGLMLCAMAGSCYAAYRLGRTMGFQDGVSSEQVAESINAAAVQNLQYVMQLASAEDSTLAALAAHPESTLAWIRDGSVRAEVQWHLADIMLKRGMIRQVHPLLDIIRQKAPADPVWASRVLTAADALAEAGNGDAKKYYRFAADRYKGLQMRAEYITALSAMSAYLMNESDDAALQALLQETESIKPEAVSLRSAVMLHRALDMQLRGNAAAAAGIFDTILAEVQKAQPNLAPAAIVCAGVTMVEQGADSALAVNLLQKGEAALGSTYADMQLRLLALRYLAKVEESRENYQLALGLLSRAEGAASGRVPKDNAFWPCLHVQRGWLHFVCRDAEHAANDFALALKRTNDVALKVQALEGASRCNIMLGKVDEAAKQAEECLQLRRTHYPELKSDIGRILLIQAKICDQKNDKNTALDLYAQAADLLTGEAEDERDNRLDALYGRAYILSKQGHWEQAAPVWEAILPLVQDQRDLLEEARSYLRHCRNNSALHP